MSMNWIKVVIKNKEVSVAFDTTSIHVYNSFPIKDDLKMRGYRWNPSDKSWYIQPGDVESELAVLKNNLRDIGPSIGPAITAADPPATRSSELAAFPDSVSVAELRNRIDRLIREGLRGNIWVRGVVASDIKHYKWASYLDLKDEDENRDMFFRMEVKKQNLDRITKKLSDSGVAHDLEKDLPLFCNVDVHLPLKYVVDIRLTLLDILPEYTQSKIRNQREITLDTLKNEGILENQKQLIMPSYISQIGLITSEQGTSVKDIKAGLHPYDNRYRFFFADSRMEGSSAVDSIIKALDQLENQADLDAVVIARGGGSEQSLAVFNDLRLCRKICRFPIPVITAIGHEKDVSAIELCSWLTPTPSTPSGVGKYLQNRYLNLQEQLSSAVTQLIHRFTTRHRQEMEKINGFLKHIPTRARSALKWREERFFTLSRGLEQSVSFAVRGQERRIADISSQIIRNVNHLQLKHHHQINTMTGNIISRAGLINRRETGQVHKTIQKMDFDRRLRLNRQQRGEMAKRANTALATAARVLNNAAGDLETRTRLVKASDPQHILKKGFTLTLDENNNVITTVKDFEGKQKAVLRFHDGTAPITLDSQQKKKNNREEQ